MVFAITATMTLFILGLSKRSIIPNRMQMLSELSYNFIANMLRDSEIKEKNKTYEELSDFPELKKSFEKIASKISKTKF